jgi:DNA-binding response OmpR family regulator
MKTDILLIEDDLELQSYIVEYLKEYHFNTIATDMPLQSLDILQNDSTIKLVILDLSLPQMDGFDLFKKLKQIKNIPIIISSARGDIGNKIHGFELGADDYLTKPYEPRELVLRVQNILNKLHTDTFTIGSFTLNPTNRILLLDDYSIELTKIEFDILLYLVQNANKIASREQIAGHLGLDINTKSRTIDTHILNIRCKVESDPKNPIYIKSVWGIGYKFVS